MPKLGDQPYLHPGVKLTDARLMTVAENIGYSLKIAGMSKAQRQARIAAVAQSLNISEFLDRKPGLLSGDQRQRVAMGRAMIREPKIFLYDEPLSNLDAKLRVAMRVEIRRLQRRLGTTTLFVTHDPGRPYRCDEQGHH